MNYNIFMNQPAAQTFHGFPIENHESLLASGVNLEELENEPLHRVDKDLTHASGNTQHVRYVIVGLRQSIEILLGEDTTWIEKRGGIGLKSGDESIGTSPLYVILRNRHPSLAECTLVQEMEFDGLKVIKEAQQ